MPGCKNPWDAAREVELVRGNEIWPPEAIDRGVNYFVLALERMGCTTLFSCEGHPDGFYVSFLGPHEVAAWIDRISVFEVSVRSHSRWGSNFKMHLGRLEFSYLRNGKAWDEAAKVKTLRHAARAWERWLQKAPPVPLGATRPSFTVLDEGHPTISEAELQTLRVLNAQKGPA